MLRLSSVLIGARGIRSLSFTSTGVIATIPKLPDSSRSAISTVLQPNLDSDFSLGIGSGGLIAYSGRNGDDGFHVLRHGGHES